MYDPIVDEVRQYRDEHARRFDYNIEAICNDYKKKHSKYLNLLNKKRNNAGERNANYG